MAPPDGTHAIHKNPNCFNEAPPIPPKHLLPASNEYVPPGFQRVKSHTLPATLASNALLRTMGLSGPSTKTIIAGVSYCTASVSMVLLNKIALSQYPLRSPTALLLVQCTLCAVLALLLHAARVVQVQRITWPIVKMWMPCNIVFVMMLFSRCVGLSWFHSALTTSHTVSWRSSFSVCPC